GFLEAQKVPAIYVFGDSLVDVGNNNYLNDTLLKAMFPYYGIDFPTKKPAGRFSNGKNAADLIAEKIGVPTSPPYLSLVSKIKNNNRNVSFLGGVSFASGGAAIFNVTHKSFRLYKSGSRRFEIAGVAAIGCCPTLRLKNKTECFSEANLLSVEFNKELQSMLKQWESENKNISYSFFDTYSAIQDIIHDPTSHGIITFFYISLYNNQPRL
ncbi:GDSL esterase/lipase, partial [Trifolium pratense]